MLFTSAIFLLVFLPVTLAGFVALGRLNAAPLTKAWLLAASMLFYAWWSPVFLLVLAGSTGVNWGLARAIERREGAARRAVLVTGLAWNLGLLGYFKYADFFITIANQVAGADWTLLHIILPLGISFFTFQKIAYLVDVHRGLAQPGRLIDFGLFVFFFPQLIAGPIVHHAEVTPQFRAMAAGRFHVPAAFWQNLAVGLTLFAIGLAKKIGIADSLALYATPVFDAAARGHPIDLLAGWQGALAYSGQLYFDFSGYSDMAIGLARLFGVRLPVNFASPYKATSIVEFWRRWHITLSRFLRDYLYIPLGGNRQGPARRRLNLFLVMLLGGLWHGAGWTFVVWGGLHGLYLLAAHAWRDAGAPRIPPLLGWGLTLLAVTVAWVFFRAPDLATALNVLGGMVGLNEGVPLTGAKRGTGVLLALAALALAALAPNSQEILRRYRPTLEAVRAPAGRSAALLWRPSSLAAAACAALVVAAVLSSWSASEFLYFQF